MSLTSARPPAAGQTSINGADPSVVRVDGTYISVESTGGGVAVSEASSTDGLSSATGGNDYPYINEAPEAIQDPNGRLHIVYSANDSWSDQYSLPISGCARAEIRPTSGTGTNRTGCLIGSNAATMMSGWDPTRYANGPGHNSFGLLDGDIATSPPAGPKFQLMYHAVPKGTHYSWDNRYWYTGSFCRWRNTTYSRSNVLVPTQVAAGVSNSSHSDGEVAQTAWAPCRPVAKTRRPSPSPALCSGWFDP